MKKFVLLIIGLIIFSSLILAEAPKDQNCDCSRETNPLLINISTINQINTDLTNKSNYYENLSEYYKDLYESKEINITNRELITLHQQIYNLNWTVNDIKNELSFLKLTLKISIPIISVTFFSLLGFSIYLRRKIKERGNG